MFAFLYHIIVSHLDILVRKGGRGDRRKLAWRERIMITMKRKRKNFQYRYFYK